MSLVESVVADVGDDPVVQALVGGVVIAPYTTAGACSALAIRDPSERLLDGTVGLAAVVMLSASFTGLILSRVEAGRRFGVPRCSPASPWARLCATVPTAGSRRCTRSSAGGGRSRGLGVGDGAGDGVADDVGRATVADDADASDPAGDVNVGSTPHLDGPRFHSVVFVVAITLRNLRGKPAVGVAFGSGDPAGGGG